MVGKQAFILISSKSVQNSGMPVPQLAPWNDLGQQRRAPFMRIAGCLLAGLLLVGGLPLPAVAAMAEEYTVLYYLMEMHRQRGIPCPGGQPEKVPHLIPSEALRTLARESVESGLPFDQVRTARGVAPEELISRTTVSGGNAQGAIRQMAAEQCNALMDSRVVYVGAFSLGGTWTVLMAAREPVLQGGPLPVATPPAGGMDGQQGAPLVTPPPPPPPKPAVPRPGIVPLDDIPPPAPVGQAAQPGYQPGYQPAPQAGVTPLEPSYQPAPQAGVTPLAPVVPVAPVAPAGNAAMGQGKAPAYKGPGEQVMLKDKNGKMVPVVIVGDDSGPLAEGGMLIDKNNSEGFVGEAPTNLMNRGGAASKGKPVQPAPKGQGASTKAPVVVGATGGPVVKDGPTTDDPLASTLAPEAADLFAEVNELRSFGQMCGGTAYSAGPLKLNAALSAAAQQHAQDMSARGYFSSTTPEGQGVGQRLTQAGYVWAKASENIAVSTPPASDVVQYWIKNKDQCKNMLNKEYHEAGVGFAPGGIWVFTLAAPAK